MAKEPVRSAADACSGSAPRPVRVRGSAASGPSAREGWRLRVLRVLRDERGQAAVEFTGMLPVILATVALLWQAALIGYTFSLAGDAADEAARAAAVDPGQCAAAAQRDLPGSFTARPSCGTSGDVVTADVRMDIPVLFPGFTIPVTVTGHGAAVKEDPS